jgi:transposase
MMAADCTMDTALQQLSHSDLILLIESERAEQLQAIESERAERIKHEKQITHYQARVFSLEFQVKELQRLIFGSTRERFISDVHASQLPLGLGVDAEQVAAAVEAAKEEITYERGKPGKKHEGRVTLPEHLPVVETVIEPEGDLTDMKRIGAEVTDELELQPAKVFIWKFRLNGPPYSA